MKGQCEEQAGMFTCCAVVKAKVLSGIFPSWCGGLDGGQQLLSELVVALSSLPGDATLSRKNF